MLVSLLICFHIFTIMTTVLGIQCVQKYTYVIKKNWEKFSGKLNDPMYSNEN